MGCGALVEVFHPLLEVLGASRRYGENLVGATLLNRPCRARFEFSQSSNMNFEHRIRNQKMYIV